MSRDVLFLERFFNSLVFSPSEWNVGHHYDTGVHNPRVNLVKRGYHNPPVYVAGQKPSVNNGSTLVSVRSGHILPFVSSPFYHF